MRKNPSPLSAPSAHPGQMLIEVIVAMGILVLFVTGFIAFVLGAYDGDRRARERTEATYIAREGIEGARSIARHDFDLLSDGEHGIAYDGTIFTLTGSSTVHEKYTRILSIVSAERGEDGSIVDSGGEEDTETKEVTSIVTWDSGRVQLVTLLADWSQPRWAFDLRTQAGSGYIHATDFFSTDDGVAFRGEGGLSVPHIFFEEQVFDDAVVRDLEVEPRGDRLYVLSQINELGPEFIAYDLSDVSNINMPIIGETELGADGMKFILGEEYAYALTGHGDRDVVRIRLSDFAVTAMWKMPGETKPIDIAVDEDRGRAYVLTSNTAQSKSVAQLPPSIVSAGDRWWTGCRRYIFRDVEWKQQQERYGCDCRNQW